MLRQLNMLVDPKLYAEFADICRRRDVTMSQTIRQFMREFVEAEARKEPAA
jgi:antitoxin component of RelBE/YafQ-DinJ toxin-antitoxin module